MPSSTPNPAAHGAPPLSLPCGALLVCKMGGQDIEKCTQSGAHQIATRATPSRRAPITKGELPAGTATADRAPLWWGMHPASRAAALQAPPVPLEVAPLSKGQQTLTSTQLAPHTLVSCRWRFDEGGDVVRTALTDARDAMCCSAVQQIPSSPAHALRLYVAPPACPPPSRLQPEAGCPCHRLQQVACLPPSHPKAPGARSPAPDPSCAPRSPSYGGGDNSAAVPHATRQRQATAPAAAWCCGLPKQQHAACTPSCSVHCHGQYVTCRMKCHAEQTIEAVRLGRPGMCRRGAGWGPAWEAACAMQAGRMERIFYDTRGSGTRDAGSHCTWARKLVAQAIAQAKGRP